VEGGRGGDWNSSHANKRVAGTFKEPSLSLSKFLFLSLIWDKNITDVRFVKHEIGRFK